MTELMKALINIYYPPAIKQQRLSGTFSAPLIRGSAQYVSISHPSHSYLCMLQTPWIPRRTIFPRLMPHPDVQCLWIYSLECLYCSPEALVVCITGLHIFRLWKKHRCKLNTRILYKGNLRSFEGQGEVAICRCAWGCFVLSSLPASGLSTLKGITSTRSFQLGAASQVTETPKITGGRLPCRFLGQI